MHFVHFRAIIYFSRWLRTHCAYSASVLCDKYDKEITNFEEDKTDTHKYGMVGVVLKLVAEMVRMVVVLMVMLTGCGWPIMLPFPMLYRPSGDASLGGGGGIFSRSFITF